jgi:hypothetical protein
MTGIEDRPRMPLRKRLVFAVIAILLALGIPLASLLAVDVYLHGKYARSGGSNIWGYRGPVLHGKRPDEFRAAMFGGSTTYGYGVTWDEAIPALLQSVLASRVSFPVSVVNLGYKNDGAYADAFTMADYQYLRYDLAILYSGYNDLMGDSRAPNVAVFRHDSPVFRLTGYLPIFPLVFKEKAAAMMNGGDPGALYRRDGTKTVFRPGLATRTQAQVLETAAAVGESLERQLGKTNSPKQIVGAEATGCKTPWEQYCAAVQKSIKYALEKGQDVLVVTPPYQLGPTVHARQVEQQTEMANMVARRFGSNARLRYVNLGDAIDLADTGLSHDGMHLTPDGNRRIAALLVEPVLDMAARRRARR